MEKLATIINSIKPELESVAVGAFLAVVAALIDLATGGNDVTLSLVGSVVVAALVNYLTSYLRANKDRLIGAAVKAEVQPDSGQKAG